MTVRRGSFWARLKQAGARANGLSEADAVQVGAVSRVETGQGDREAYCREYGPQNGPPQKGAGGSDAEEQAEIFLKGGGEGELEKRAVERERAGDDWWQVWNGARSLAATGFAAIVLATAELWDPTGPRWDRLALGGAVYGIWFASAFAAMCALCRLGQGAFGLAVTGEFRFGAAVVAMALLWSEAPVAMSLAGWVAVAAVAMGGIADGAWLAVVSLRREVPPWRALAIVFREEKQARRELWRRLYWGGSR